MKGSGLDLFDPQTGVMESGYSLGSSREGDFGFAFNDSSFSDRVLLIEIVADPPGTLFNRDGSPSLADWIRNRKGHKENIKENDISHNISKCSKNQIFTCDHPASEDTLSCEFHDEAAIARIEEPPSDDEPADSNESNWKANYPAVLSIKALHISSLILAAKSPFFYKLFSDGMKKLGQRHVSLLIFASEEGAFMELLNFMYSNTLTTTAMPALLDILVAADKFEVVSCMKYCSQLLLNFPLTLESALLYLELPSIVIMAEKVQPMTDAAKQFLVTRYRDITKFQEEVLKLPLAGIEAILSSHDLQVPSEDVVYDITLKWTRAQYPKVEDRQEILGSRLVHFIRFPYMTCRKLKKVLTSNDFDPEVASKVVFEALFFKSEALHRRKTLVAQSPILNHCRFVERAYRHRPVKVVEFELPHQQCVVYLDLKREECANLFPSGRIYSQAFHLGGQGFFLSAHCNMDVHNSFHCFGLFLGMQEKVTQEKGSVTMLVDYEFAARSKPTNEYISKYKGSYTFTGGKAIGYRNLFSTPWTPLMAEDSLHFINGILHLRVEVTIRN